MNLFKLLKNTVIGLTVATLGNAILSASAQAQVTSIYQLQLVARPNGQGPYCIDIDVSKIGIIQGANNAKVSPCRNIQEQRFVLQNAANGMVRFQMQANPSQCLAVDGTKVGILNGAQNARTEQCRDIQEINHGLSNFGNGIYGLVLQARASNGAQLCQAVDGTKIGIIRGAEQVRVEGCRNIQEMQWRLVEVDRIGSNPIMRQPVTSPIPTTGTLPRTGGAAEWFLDGIRFGRENNYQTIINGARYTFDEYSRLRETVRSYANAVYNKPITLNRNSKGERIAFIAHWGIYIRTTGDDMDLMTSDIAFAGGSIGTLLASTMNPVVATLGSGSYTYAIGRQVQICKSNKNQAYVRFHLASGSWVNSAKLLPFQGIAAFGMYADVSCD